MSDQQTFALQDQIVNVFGFASPGSSFTLLNCHHGGKAGSDGTYMNKCDCVQLNVIYGH